MIDKLRYGLRRLKNELTNKEDYWHIRFYAREVKPDEMPDKYYLDVSGKADYPFELKNNIPLVAINGVKTALPVTILNYGLGHLDREPINKNIIRAVFNWLKDNQTSKGAWLQHFDDATYQLKSGWISGMTQGLAMSFLIRGEKAGILHRDEVQDMIESALSVMLSDSCVSKTRCGRFIEEYGGTNSHVLNGYVFSVFGLLDYAFYSNQFDLYREFEMTLRCMVPEYNYHSWTYYDRRQLIASRLYHNLHLEMMKAMYHITGEKIYETYYKKWKNGDRLNFIFVLRKALQKFSSLSKLDTLDQ